MPIFDADIVVSPSNIKLGEVFCILGFIDKVRDERKRIDVLDGMLIQVVVILARMEFPILLFDEEEGGGFGRVGGADLSKG